MIIFYVIPLAFAILLFFLSKLVKPIHWKDTKESNIQLCIQLLIYTVGFLLMVFAHYSLYIIECSPVCLFYCLSVLNIYTLFRLLQKVTENNRIPIKSDNAKPLLKIIAFTWYGIFCLMCEVNYSLMVIFPKSYDGLDSLSFAERAFNAVYYTFSIMFTYSGNGIVSVDVLSRSVEIIEILCCYVFIGIIITSIIGKTAENI